MTFKISAIVLAAGRSTRMGRAKLLEPVDGKAMLRHAVEAALASDCSPVIVVTGNERRKVRAAVADLPVIFCNNPDYTNGLSTSLKCGLNALAADCDGALVLLGDMPWVEAGLLDRLMAGFNPAAGRAIIVPTRSGRQGNPVLWGRQCFPAMQRLSGDAGARSLFGHFPELVFAVEARSDAPFTDIDTEEDLTTYRERQAAQAKT